MLHRPHTFYVDTQCACPKAIVEVQVTVPPWVSEFGRFLAAKPNPPNYAGHADVGSVLC
jgi:hypothetical protein